MGHHYVPQQYLRAFAADAGCVAIWQYDRKAQTFCEKPAAIKNVLQPRAFYSPEDETKLGELVEKPANIVMRKILNGDYSLDNAERSALSLYMLTMIKRVPKFRQKGEAVAPGVLTKVVSETKEVIDELNRLGRIDSAVASRRMDELNAFEEKFKNELPEEIQSQMRSPWPSFELVTIVHNMDWQLVAAPDGEFFVTSDNPMFFFESFGLGNPESEFTFPISSKMAIFGFRSGSVKLRSPVISKPFVREANRRIISAATQFVMSCRRDEWISMMAKNRNLHLSQIRWMA